MATDICYSVPLHFVHADWNTNRDPQTDPQTNGIISLLWSLGAAAGTVGASNDMTNWCLELLDYIGHRAGNRFALLTAARVRSGRPLIETSVLSTLDFLAKEGKEHDAVFSPVEGYGLATPLRESG